jgi:hypothetical protein
MESPHCSATIFSRSAVTFLSYSLDSASRTICDNTLLKSYFAEPFLWEQMLFQNRA